MEAREEREGKEGGRREGERERDETTSLRTSSCQLTPGGSSLRAWSIALRPVMFSSHSLMTVTFSCHSV